MEAKLIDQKAVGLLLTSHIQDRTVVDWLRNLCYTSQLPAYLPELRATVGHDGGPHHDETVFEHLMLSLNHLITTHPITSYLELAVLFHDIGKPATYDPVEHTFHKHEVVGATITYNMLKRLGFPHHTVVRVSQLVRWHMFGFDKNTKDKTIRRWLYQIGKNTWGDLYTLRLCDRIGNKKRSGSVAGKTLDLDFRIRNIIKKTPVVFREDLKINETEILKITKNKNRLDATYANLIGMINQDPEKNNNEWLTAYLVNHPGQEWK